MGTNTEINGHYLPLTLFTEPTPDVGFTLISQHSRITVVDSRSDSSYPKRISGTFGDLQNPYTLPCFVYKTFQRTRLTPSHPTSFSGPSPPSSVSVAFHLNG